VTGGWQTSKESAYVQASHAREGTEWFLAGTDDRPKRPIGRFGLFAVINTMNESQSQLTLTLLKPTDVATQLGVSRS
jgi:hypothetical protein